MIRYRVEVERLFELNIKPTRVSNRFALGVAIGVVGRGQSAKRESVERVRRVHMQVAKQRPGFRSAFVTRWQKFRRRFEHRIAAEPLHQIGCVGVIVRPRTSEPCKSQHRKCCQQNKGKASNSRHRVLL